MVSARELDGVARTERMEIEKACLLEVGVIILEDGAQAGLVDDEVAPERRTLVAGELEGVVTVDQIGDPQNTPGVHMRALSVTDDPGQVVGVAAVDRDTSVGGSRVPAPELEVELDRLQQPEVLLHANLEHPAALGLGPDGEGRVDHHFGGVDAEPAVSDRIPVLESRFVPPEPQKPPGGGGAGLRVVLSRAGPSARQAARARRRRPRN